MRLGIDASNLRDGGAVTHLSSVLAAADASRHGITRVVVWGSRATLDHLPERPWLHVRRESALEGALPRRLWWQRFALPLAARETVDLLWVPGGNAPGGFEPYVAMSQNMLPFEPHERARYGASWMRLRLKLLETSQSRTFRRASGLIFLTDYARAAITHRVGPIRGAVATIPHGVAGRFRRPPVEQRPLSSYSESSPFRLLAVSIVDVYKHQWVVAEAVARLRAKGLPVILDIVGGSYPPALRRLTEVLGRVDPAGLTIRYRGRVPFAELHECYHAADAFVFASSCENLPIILLEAMAAGLPIACSDRGPMPEVLDDAGCYFDPEDAGSIGGALERLIAEPDLRRRYAEAGFRRAQDYTWERCAEATFAFLAGVGGAA